MTRSRIDCDPSGDYAKTITSRQNALVQRRERCATGKDTELVFVEGLRLCEEAARAARRRGRLFTETFADDERAARLLDRSEPAAKPSP